MKLRILTAAVLLRLLVGILFFAPTIVGAVVTGALAAMASYELLYNTGMLRHVRLNVYSCVMAFGISMLSYFSWNYGIGVLAMLVYFMVVFVEVMLSHLTLHVKDAFLCFLSGIIIPFMITSLVRILCMEEGRLLIAIPFVVAYMSDGGAYFIGVFFGKHKLCPEISPKKSVEGLVGGIVSAVLGMLIYGWVVNHFFQADMPYWALALYGGIGAVASAFGDLCLSVIKRQTGIKDYGNLFPGHGGVLDRLDSVLVAAPLTEALLLLIPMVN